MRRVRATTWLAVAITTGVLLAAVTWLGSATAAHESTNMLVFAPVDASAVPAASGQGVIDYRGGEGEESRWTVQLRFRGLAPGSTYVAALQGYRGEPDTPEATAFTELCVVRTSASGDGGCWWYLLGMRRVDVVQLRAGSLEGAPVLQATRKGDGPGSITSVRNEFSPPEGSPAASPVLASPISASPVAVASVAETTGSPGESEIRSAV